MSFTDYLIYIDEKNKELFLLKRPIDDKQLDHCFGTRIKISIKDAYFSQQILCLPAKEHLIKIPVKILIKIGIVPRNMLKAATDKNGLYQIEETQDAQKYFLYCYEEGGEIFLLQQEVPPDRVAVNHTINTQSKARFDDFNDVPQEEFIQRYGRSFRIKGDHMTVTTGMIYVPRRSKLIQIPLNLLLAAKLTTPDIIKSIAGKYVFTR